MLGIQNPWVLMESGSYIRALNKDIAKVQQEQQTHLPGQTQTDGGGGAEMYREAGSKASLPFVQIVFNA